MKLKGSLTTPTCGRFYGKKLNLVVLSQLVGFFNSLCCKSFSAEDESFAQGGGGLEIKNRKLNRFNSAVEPP